MDDDFLGRQADKLYRRYSKDELIRFYKSRLSINEIEHGKDISYIDELEHENLILKGRIEALEGENSEYKREAMKEIKREQLYQQLLTHNRKLTSENKRLKKTNDELIIEKVNNAKARKE